MPNTKTAKKALRQSIRKNERNVKQKNEVKKTVKEFKKLTTAKADEAKTYLSQVYKKLDKAAKTNVISKNKASRLKSKYSKLVK